MQTVLESIREIKKSLQENEIVLTDPQAAFPFQPMIKVLGEILKANTYLINETGELLGFISIYDVINSERTNAMMIQKQIDPAYMELIADINDALENIDINDDRTIFAIEYRDKFPDGKTVIIPIISSTYRFGYLILARPDQSFDARDMILGEYIATVLAVEMNNLLQKRKADILQQQNLVSMAVQSLSYSELEALKLIFRDVEEPSFRITASKIAEEEGITRSIIVNALRKLESAGVISSRSLGMKGTFIDAKTQINLQYLKNELASNH